MNKPRLLDLFCGAGGCTKGYQRAGFHVTGVDINPQPRYCGEVFVQGDALAYLAEHGHKFDAIHASPPCQTHSILAALFKGTDYHERHPDLIPITRQTLIATRKPYVIENVPGAPLEYPTVLCGTMFGLKTFRHRLFETSFFMLAPTHAPHTLYGKAAKNGRPVTAEHQYITITGHFSGKEVAAAAMGIDWMTRDELAQAIPPAYTEFIGQQLIEVLS